MQAVAEGTTPAVEDTPACMEVPMVHAITPCWRQLGRREVMKPEQRCILV
mgnify:CR=1 FL=1